MVRGLLDWFGLVEAHHGHHHGDRPHDHGHSHPHGHVHTHGVIDPTIATTARGIAAIKWSFLVLFLTAVMQAVVVWMSGSVALLADTIHNVADASTAIPLWIAFVLARRPPSPRFTFGLGRVEDLAGVAIVLVILSSALVALWEAIDRLIHPAPITNLLAVALAGITGFVGNEVAAYIRIKTGREINSAALIADGYHARIDGLTSLAVVLGVAGVWAGFAKADPLAGVLITGMIFGIVWQSAKAVITRMLDGVEPGLVRELEHAAEHAEGVSRVQLVRARWIGHRLHAEMTLAIDDALSVVESNRLSETIREHARAHLPALASLHVEVTPASSDGSAKHRPETKAEHSH